MYIMIRRFIFPKICKHISSTTMDVIARIQQTEQIKIKANSLAFPFAQCKILDFMSPILEEIRK